MILQGPTVETTLAENQGEKVKVVEVIGGGEFDALEITR